MELLKAKFVLAFQVTLMLAVGFGFYMLLNYTHDLQQKNITAFVERNRSIVTSK